MTGPWTNALTAVLDAEILGKSLPVYLKSEDSKRQRNARFHFFQMTSRKAYILEDQGSEGWTMPDWEEYFQFLSKRQVELLAVDFWNDLILLKEKNHKLSAQLKNK